MTSACYLHLSLTAWTMGLKGGVSSLTPDPLAAPAITVFFCSPCSLFLCQAPSPPSLPTVIATLFRFPMGSSCLIFVSTPKGLRPSLFPSLDVWPKAKWLLRWEWEKQACVSRLSKTVPLSASLYLPISLCFKATWLQTISRGRCLLSSAPQGGPVTLLRKEVLFTKHVPNRKLFKYLS